jgi:hypothetical protein
MKPFCPLAGATVSLAAGASSTPVALEGLPAGQVQVRIHNAGTEVAFVAFGGSDVAAQSGADLPLPAGIVEVLTLDNPQRDPITHAAAITASGSATLYFTPGQGL